MQTITSHPAYPRSRNFVAGYASGCALVLAGHPFDTIKVRMQSEGLHGRFKNPLDALVKTVRNEGVRGLYKGMATPFLLTGGVNSVLFGMQGLALQYVTAANPKAPTPGETAQAGVLTGFFISFAVTPMEGIKSRLQVQYNSTASSQATSPKAPLYRGPWHAFQSVYKELGIAKGVFRGFVPTAVCRMSNWSYFGSYALIKQKLAPEGEKLNMTASVLAGGAAGICYWLSCYPMDVIKARMMAQPDTLPLQYSGVRDCARQIWKAEGYRGFFGGFTPCLLRAFPANAACFVAFEIAMNILPQPTTATVEN